MRLRSFPARAFTLVELLIVIAIIAVFAALLFPVLSTVKQTARASQCVSGLHQIHLALQMYLGDNDNTYFPYYYDLPNAGRQWYFGYEPNYGKGDKEGERLLILERAFLFPYLKQIGGVSICPSFRYSSSYYKPKFRGASFGYGYNVYGLAGTKEQSIRNPEMCLVFADSAQVNDFQWPASRDNPLLEEFPIISPYDRTFHFRHQVRANCLFADGHVKSLSPHPDTLDPRLDGLCGMVAKRGDGTLFNLK